MTTKSLKSPLKTLRELSEATILALTIFGEARGEPVEGQIAVGCVVRNRMVRRNQNVHDVVLAPLQFSCWNNPDYLFSVWRNSYGLPPFERKILSQCHWIAEGILGNIILDNTNGADHYINPRLIKKRVRWLFKMRKVARIGRHVFYVSRRSV